MHPDAASLGGSLVTINCRIQLYRIEYYVDTYVHMYEEYVKLSIYIYTGIYSLEGLVSGYICICSGRKFLYNKHTLASEERFLDPLRVQ